MVTAAAAAQEAPTVAPVSAQLRYVPHIISGGGFATKLTITNLVSSANNVVINYVSQTGSLISSTPYSLAPGATLRLSTPEADRFAANKTQWAIIGSDSPVGINVFFELSGSGGASNVINTIGFNDAPPLQQFTIPVELQSGATTFHTVGLALANPTMQAATVTLAVFDGNGSRQATATVALGAYAQAAIDIGTLPAFKAVLPAGDLIGTLRVTSTVPISAIALGDDSGPFFSTPPIAAGRSGQLLIPHIVSGGGFVTKLTLIDMSGAPQTATVQFFDTSGKALQQQAVTLKANGAVQISTPEANRFGTSQTEWAIVTAPAAAAVNLFFEYDDSSGKVLNTIGFNDVAPATDFTIPVEIQLDTGSGGRTVGLALSNANNAVANVTMQLIDATGQSIGTTSVSLNPNAQTAIDVTHNGALTAALPPGDFVGVLTISSSQPVAAIALGDDFGPFYSTPLIAGRSGAVRTYQSGAMLYLESSSAGQTARIGLYLPWGGNIVEASLNGTNFVNRHDTGREIQPALYDATATYDSCAGCTGVWGWDPVLGGDRFLHGSPVLAQAVGPDSIYTKVQPLQWAPDATGGSATVAVPADMYFEQTVSAVPQFPLAFRVHYRLTHFGADNHYTTTQEFPAVFTNAGYDTFVYYGGSSPWTAGAVTKTSASVNADPSAQKNVYAPERWAAAVDSNDFGLAVFVPGAYPYAVHEVSFPGSGGSGPFGDATNYFRIHTAFTNYPSSVFEGDVYVIPGDYRQARQLIYAINEDLPVHDVMPPTVSVDAPTRGSTVSGAIHVTGWTFDDFAVARVEVLVDGVLQGQATYGSPRPDVAAAYVGAPVNTGFDYVLNTFTQSNGVHTIAVRATDTSNNVAIAPRLVTVSNDTTAGIRTSQSGSMVYVDNSDGSNVFHAAANLAAGGMIAEFSLNGSLYGSETTINLRDGAQDNQGWNPNLAGDRYGHPSPVIANTLNTDSVFVKTQPLEYYPDNKGGGSATPVPSDVYVEQTITAVPTSANAFRVHLKLTHFGSDTHYNASDQFPSISVTRGHDTFISYAGTSPWTNDAVAKTTPPGPPGVNTNYAAEQWAAFVDSNDSGVTLYVPGQYPYETAFAIAPTSGSDGYNYLAPFVPLTLGPGAVVEQDVYVFLGDYKTARQAIYGLHQQLAAHDSSAPWGFLDAPQANATLHGTAQVFGWALDNGTIARIDVLVDGAVVGQAVYGTPRPDIPAAYPNATPNAGFTYALDTTRLSNGPHTVGVRGTDAAGNAALFTPTSVNVSN